MAGDANKKEALRKGEFEPGTRIGRYRLDEVVGRGGMGTVYRTFDEETQREVATKILLPGLPESLHERFLAECEAEARIRHPHVMPVYDRGTFEGNRPYFVMELLYEPITLSDLVETSHKGALGKTWPRLRQWGAPDRLAADVLVPIAEGVDAANREYGILHRDLKPDNVLIDVRTRRPYLIDFGICHLENQPVEERKIVGTPRFLAPEQARAHLTPQTDVWGLGALLRFLFTAAPPIPESSPLRRQERDQKVQELLRAEAKARSAGEESRADELAARRGALESPDFRSLDDMLDDARLGRYPPLPESMPAAARAICEKAMAVAPAERYENAQAFADDLRAWTQGAPVRALEERDARGAAMAAAQRTVRRYLAPALLTALGLVLGLALGAAFLSGPAETTLERRALAQDEVVRLEAEMEAVDADALTPAEMGLRHGWLESRLAVARARAEALPPGDTRQTTLERLETLAARLAVPALVVEADADARFKALRIWDGRTFDVTAGRNELPPGLYQLGLEGRGWLRVPFELRWAPNEEAPPRPVRLTLRLPERPPTGTVYVPGDAPFFLGDREVTVLEYADWIDALPDAERRDRLPPEGFVPDPSNRGRYLVSPGHEERPVTGLRPADVEAYLAWRRELFGRGDRLPTAEEWERAAGLDLLTPRHARLFGDRSPFGAARLLEAPPELVRTDAGYGIKGLFGTWTRDALASTGRADAEGRTDAGFRLVVPAEK